MGGFKPVLGERSERRDGVHDAFAQLLIFVRDGNKKSEKHAVSKYL